MEFLFVFVFGVILGSFANVLIYRIPKNLNLYLPFSFCPQCKKTLLWRDKIPLFSYLFLNKKCRHCQSKIPFWYFLSECLGGFFAVFSFYHYGIGGIICFFLCLFFYTLCVIDWYFLEIPNILSFLTFGLGICYGFYADLNAFYSPINPFLNAFVLMGIASFLRLFIGSICNKEVMGEGDIIIFGILGGALGIFYAFVAIFIAAITTLCVMLVTKTYKMPFVPFLFFGFLLLLIVTTF